MKKKVQFRSPIAAAMHETVRGMHRVGVVDRQTMREFDARCLIHGGEPVSTKRRRQLVSAQKKAPPSR